mmetsp:Transcript_29625/g.57764  ORF Transcript_29625/g.57764 Transcript_29625/m.57764 type:complete len:231 (+) Transcript_29625:349-1041(+)
MSVFLNGLRSVKEDDVADILDVKSSFGDGCGNENLDLPRAKCGQRSVALFLRSATMDVLSCGAAVVDVVPDLVNTAFGLNEDKCLVHVSEIVHQLLHLGPPSLNVTEFLGDEVCGGPDPSNLHQSKGSLRTLIGVVEKLACGSLNLFWKRCAEHEGLPPVAWRHAKIRTHDFADIGQKTHIQHPVGLVQDDSLDVVHRNLLVLQEIFQATRCSRKDMAPFFKIHSRFETA